MGLALTSRSIPRSSLDGFLFGVVFHGLTFSWWYGLLRTYGRLSWPEAAGVFIALMLYLGAYAGLFSAGLALLARRRGAATALLAAPALWAGLELVRGRAFSGLPWSVLGATQQPHPILIQVADLGGVTAVSLVVACGNAAVTWAILSRREGVPSSNLRGSMRWAGILVAVPLLAVVYGAVRLAWMPEESGRIRVGLIQGNVPQDEKWQAAERMKILDTHLEATREAAARGAGLVVWPESSVPLPLTSSETYRTLLEALARSLEIDLLVGSVHYDDVGAEGRVVYNSAFLMKGGRGDRSGFRYDKIHLVPFGEYVPLRAWLGPVGKMVEEAGDFSKGKGPVIFQGGGARLGPFICFEAIFPSLVRRFTVEGAQVLVNLTNDAFLGDTAGPRQHLALAAMRTVENRRWMVRAANTGISAVVDPAGRIVGSTPYGTRQVLVTEVGLVDSPTLYAVVGDLVGWGCVILALASYFAPTFPGLTGLAELKDPRRPWMKS
jgi:apolipoprotein N-acyltransferase